MNGATSQEFSPVFFLFKATIVNIKGCGKDLNTSASYWGPFCFLEIFYALDQQGWVGMCRKVKAEIDILAPIYTFSVI